MRALKILVVVMGVLLLAGSVALAVALMARLAHHPAPVPGVPARLAVTLPKGARVESVSALGDRLAVHVTTPDGALVLIVDPATGAVRETLELDPAP